MTSTVDAESITALAEDTTRLLTAMPDAVIVCDKTGRIVFANTNVTHLLGYEPEELKGERVEMLVPGVARAHHTDRRERYMRQSLTRPMSAGGDLEASHKSGNTIPVSISLSPLTEAGQAFVIAAIRDETKARELSAALAREAEERAALADLSRAISSSLDIKQVCARLSEQIAPFIPFDRIVFSSFDAARRTFTDIYVGGSGLEDSKMGNVFRLSQEQVEWIEVLREPIVSTGDQPHGFLISLPDHQEKFEAGFNSLLFTPVIWNDTLIGTLNLRSRQPDAYAARHVEFAERVAAQIAGAIANAGLHEQTLQQLEERSVLSEIGRIISASSNIEENFDLFARLVVRLIPADRISICRVWPGSGKYRFDYEWGLRSEPGFARDIHKLTGTGTGRVVETSRATLIDEMQAQAFSAHNYPDGGDPGRHLLSWLGVPLVSSGETIGVMHLRTTRPDVYGQRELAIAERICAQIAGAIANAQLHEQTLEEAAERQAIAEIGRTISSSLDIDQVFERFIERLRALIPADRVSIDYVDIDRGTFTSRFVWGIDVPARRPGAIVPLRGSLTGRVIEADENLLISGDEGYEELARTYPMAAPGIAAGIKSQIAVRLIASDRPIGMLHIQSYSDSRYTKADLARAERLAAPVAAAIDNARLHEEAQR
ncbi:MAG: GAF domain-containing protein, partial [Chloroflexi bacterium]|nr:GAF domain-containing protein [Chloroflexota bacterium]